MIIKPMGVITSDQGILPWIIIIGIIYLVIHKWYSAEEKHDRKY